MISFDKEQIFLVTGASSGLGEGTALLLNELGASVIAVGRNRERLENVRKKSKFPENVFLEEKDLTEDIAGLPQYVKSLKDKYGKLQGLAYCAGVVEVKPLQLVDYGEMKKLFDINYFSPIFMAKGFADRRVNRGRGSAAVFISSMAAFVSSRGMLTYSGSKAGLAASIRAIARETAPSGVRFNCVSPSDIVTPMTHGSEPIFNIMKEKEDKYPMGFGEVGDVARMIAYLLSDDAKWITTQNYIIDCGYM